MIGTSVTASGPGTRPMRRGPPRRPDSGSPDARKKAASKAHEFPGAPPGRSPQRRAAVSKTDGSYRGQGVEKLLGVYTYDVFFPRAGRIDLPTYTLCNRRVTDVGCVSYMQS